MSEGHYRGILWHSGTVMSCNDFRSALLLGVDAEIAASIYLIWVIPKKFTSRQWSRPKPKSFDELFSDKFT